MAMTYHHSDACYAPAPCARREMASLWLKDAAAGLCLMAALASAYFVI